VLSPRPFGLSPADLLGLASVMLAFWFAVPQLVRLRRTHSAAGLSAESLANSTVSLVAWTAYGIVHASVWVVASSLVGLPAIVTTLVLARSHGLRAKVLFPVAWAAVLAVTTAVDSLLGTHAIDVVLGCSILWFVTPAAATAWRSADVSGLAPQTWVLLAFEGLVFGLYGLVANIGADRVYGTAAVAGAAAVLARLLAGSRVPVRTAAGAVTTSGPRPLPTPSSRLLEDTMPLLRLAPDDTRPLPPVLQAV
jgi:uncharacterized protein with PQ loop repeat